MITFARAGGSRGTATLKGIASDPNKANVNIQYRTRSHSDCPEDPGNPNDPGSLEYPREGFTAWYANDEPVAFGTRLFMELRSIR